MSLQFPVAPLFAPGNRPERFAKADASGADAVIIDLEDAVAPQQKDEARRNGANAAALSQPVFVRINALGTPWYADDLAFLHGTRFGVMIPKGENAAEIRRLLDAIGARPAIVIVESALGVQASAAIAATPGVSRLAFGPADFCRDVGCAPDSLTVGFARAQVVLASRAAAIAQPLDGPTFEIRDPDRIEADAREASDLGFGGKLCIHPSQPPLVRKGFAPGEAEVAWALKVVAAPAGDGVVLVDGVMVDRPIIEAAQNTLRRAGRA